MGAKPGLNLIQAVREYVAFYLCALRRDSFVLDLAHHLSYTAWYQYIEKDTGHFGCGRDARTVMWCNGNGFYKVCNWTGHYSNGMFIVGKPFGANGDWILQCYTDVHRPLRDWALWQEVRGELDVSKCEKLSVGPAQIVADMEATNGKGIHSWIGLHRSIDFYSIEIWGTWKGTLLHELCDCLIQKCQAKRFFKLLFRRPFQTWKERTKWRLFRKLRNIEWGEELLWRELVFIAVCTCTAGWK